MAKPDGSRTLRLNESAVGRLALEHACFPLFLSYYFASPTWSLSNACIEPSWIFLHMLTFQKIYKNLSEKIICELKWSIFWSILEIFYLFVEMESLKLSDCSANTHQQRTCYSTVMPNETQSLLTLLFHNQLGYFRPTLCPRIHRWWLWQSALTSFLRLWWTSTQVWYHGKIPKSI